MGWLEALVFGGGTLGLLTISWKSMRSWRLHGFFRFFAFEAILFLVAMNVGVWFATPFVVHQIVSWLLLTASLVMAIHGFFLLRDVGKPTDKPDDIADWRIEQTTKLVRVGAYKYIRHPLYCSLLLFAWGVFFKNVSALGGVFVLLATGFLIATGRVEEQENLKKFGVEYAHYMKATKMFIPGLI